MNARIAVFAVAATAAATAIWFVTKTSAGPAATWRVGRGTAIEQGRNYAELAAESPFRLSLHTTEPLHAYVFSHSHEDGTLLLWPSPELRSNLAQPLPAGHAVLPGQRDGKELAWTTRSQIQTLTTYVAVLSKAPVPELETLLPRLRRWTTSVLTDGSMQVSNPTAKPASGLAGLPQQGWPAPLLQQAADRFAAETLVNGPLQPAPGQDGLWFTAWRVKEQPGSAPKPLDGQPVLPDALKVLQTAPPTAPPPDKR
jgi:hypothetical protein